MFSFDITTTYVIVEKSRHIDNSTVSNYEPSRAGTIIIKRTHHKYNVLQNRNSTYHYAVP